MLISNKFYRYNPTKKGSMNYNVDLIFQFVEIDKVKVIMSNDKRFIIGKIYEYNEGMIIKHLKDGTLKLLDDEI